MSTHLTIARAAADKYLTAAIAAQRKFDYNQYAHFRFPVEVERTRTEMHAAMRRSQLASRVLAWYENGALFYGEVRA